MCGFAGFLGCNFYFEEHISRGILKEMCSQIYHRGPDDNGIWIDAKCKVYFGHQRLSILDKSINGHQPMISHSGRYVIIFNGEIYNHLEIRQELLKNFNFQSWISSSDTETLLAGFDLWGIAETIKKTAGMFSMAIWDKKDLSLYLARDRIGEKPLYYGWQEKGGKKTFMFASELKAFKKHPSFEADINRDSLTSFIRHGYIGNPFSIYKNIFKLEPGSILKLSIENFKHKIFPFWDLPLKIEQCYADKFSDNFFDIQNNFEVLLSNIIKNQMLADVPVGAFLSGGIDSSLVVALMQKQSSVPVKTFCIGFNEKHRDEARHAKTIAAHLGTDHTELYITPFDAMTVIPNLANVYDEPFADSSQIPTILVSKLAKEKVTVALTGDGADELFCGYNRYFLALSLIRIAKFIPQNLKEAISYLLINKSTNSRILMNLVFSKIGLNYMGDRTSKFGSILKSKNLNEVYLKLISYWPDPASIVINGNENNSYLNSGQHKFDNLDDFNHLMALDQLTYLPDDILTKVDRAAMSVSLETRVPFLDHRMIEFSWRLPSEYKYDNKIKKILLQATLSKYVPKDLFDRPKMGFRIPIGEWLKGPLRDWAENLLDKKRLDEEGFFNSGPIIQKWKEQKSGTSNWQHHLWNVLMFQSWIENEKNN